MKEGKTGKKYGMHGGEGHTEFWWGNLKGTHRFKDLGVDWRIILKWILNRFLGYGLD